MTKVVRIWYVSAQRLCNFRCPYCVSIGDYSKSNSDDWFELEDTSRFIRIVGWLADRSYRVGIRLATLGEPFASRTFLTQAAWLSTQPNVAYVELLTNGSLLKSRLGFLERNGNLEKISLWVTHHPTEISVSRFIENARIAQEQYGCFVVVNGLLFPNSEAVLIELKRETDKAGLRFNLDLGYDPQTPSAEHSKVNDMIPALENYEDLLSKFRDLGGNPRLIELNLSAMRDLRGRACRAGYDYFYIDIRGNVYRCSRYQALKKNRIGNVLEDDFELNFSDTPWNACEAGFGCCNKEDFLNLVSDMEGGLSAAPSLGWPAWSDVRGDTLEERSIS